MTTVGGAIAEAIKAANLALSAAGQAVYRDIAPEAATLPYVVFIDPISDVPVLSGGGAVLYRNRTAQVSLYQAQVGENDALREGLLATLDGAELVASEEVLRCRVWTWHRIPADAFGVVQVDITLRIWHAGY